MIFWIDHQQDYLIILLIWYSDSKEKPQNNLNSINSLIVDGVLLNNHKEISNYCEQFYK